MKGPSLKRQYDKIQETISKNIEEASAYYKREFHKELDEYIKKFKESFCVQENPYYCSDYPGVGSCTVMPIRSSRWQLYILDEEKFKECTGKGPKDIKCKECQSCGLFDIDGHYSIPCAGIMKIGIDL